MGKLFLQNAFFRTALRVVPEPRFIGRADDDAIVPLRPMASLLTGLVDASSNLLLLGPIRSWYMWDTVAMRPACFDPGTNRRAKARCSSERELRSGSNYSVSDQCCAPGLVGPFPFAGGAATIYSRPLISALLSDGKLEADESYVLGARNASSLRNPVDGQVYPRNHRKHPAASVFLEDVYYAAIVRELFHNRSLMLVNIPTWDPPWYSRVWNQLPAALVYHNLKRLALFEKLRTRWHNISVAPRWRLICEPGSTRAGEVGRFTRNAGGVAACCAGWQACTLMASERKRPARAYLSEHYARLISFLLSHGRADHKRAQDRKSVV